MQYLKFQPLNFTNTTVAEREQIDKPSNESWNEVVKEQNVSATF